MALTNGYKTKQRDLILNYFIENNNRHVTAEEVVDHLKCQGTSVGKSTVYRYLEKLVEQGMVRRFFIEEGYGACYQYTGNDKQCHEHFHLKCLSCGVLLHIQCDFLVEAERHIFNDHDFIIDNTKTVLYGLCEKCKDSEEKGMEYSV